jgi:hypothetical protein
MSTPRWWDDVVGGSAVLAAADRSEIEKWRGDEPYDDEGVPDGEVDDDLPLTIRLAYLARAFAENIAELSPEQRRHVLEALERVLASGSDYDRDAVATGFFEALLGAWDRGFDLRPVWEFMGPRSRAHCLGWNRFAGVESPAWMRNV